LNVYETPVGFNYIADYMLKGNVLIGGEESGGISIKGHVPEGDGILMGLLLLEILADAGVPLVEIVTDLAKNNTGRPATNVPTFTCTHQFPKRKW